MVAPCDLATGYRVSGTHANPLGMKTDAPWDVIWDIMRAWVADHPVKKQVQHCELASKKFVLHRLCCATPYDAPCTCTCTCQIAVAMRLTAIAAPRLGPAQHTAAASAPVIACCSAFHWSATYPVCWMKRLTCKRRTRSQRRPRSWRWSRR